MKTGIIKYLVNKKYSEYGRLAALSIDKDKKLICASLILVGEKEAIDLCLSGYSILDTKDSTYLLFNDITFSREWLNLAIEKFAGFRENGKRIALPPMLAKALKVIL